MDPTQSTVFQEVQPLLRQLLERMVQFPDALQIDVTETDTSIYVEVRAAERDIGQLLGKEGIHARALETLFRAILGRSGRYFTLHVVTSSSARAMRLPRRT